MKRFTVFAACLMFVIAFSARAQADSIFLTWGTTGPLSVGSTVSVAASFQPTSDETIYGWCQALGYDSSELAYSSYTLGSNIVGSIGFNDSALMDPSNANYTAIARYDFTYSGVNVTAGTTYQLFTANYTFKGGSADGAADIWLMNRPVSQVPDIYMELTGHAWTNTTAMHVAGGPDFYSASSPVPIPGAAWLLGSGVMGLAGIRRRFFGRKSGA